MANLHVMLSPDGHWDVKEADDGEIISHHEERDDAVRAATQLARERDGAEVRIHEVEGEIEKRAEVDADGDVTERDGVEAGEVEGADEGGATLGDSAQAS
jgi:undecaprenyl pyrophosphate synthase